MTNECKYCQRKDSPTYDYGCIRCRERALIHEPCKVLREHMALNMWKYGEVPEWKRKPHCGCTNLCKRKQLTKKE